MRTRLGLKVLGLSALVMGVMAIGTTGAAQAETGACWGYINPTTKVLSCFGTLQAGVAFNFEGETGTLLIENVNLEVLCTKGKLIEGGKLAGNGSVTTGRVQFEGCISLSKTPTLTKLNACTPSSASGLGTVITEKGDGLIRLHNGTQVVELLPVSGTTLAKIFLGEECSVSEELIVTGKLVIVDSAPTVHAKEHLAKEFASLQLMKVGVNKATIDGSAWFFLTGEHSGFEWAGLAA